MHRDFVIEVKVNKCVCIGLSKFQSNTAHIQCDIFLRTLYILYNQYGAKKINRNEIT